MTKAFWAIFVELSAWSTKYLATPLDLGNNLWLIKILELEKATAKVSQPIN
jgi:hypothetical protein